METNVFVEADGKYNCENDQNDIPGNYFRGQRRDETMDHRPPPKDDGKEDSGDDNQAQPYQFKRACKCSAPRAVGEVSTFDQRQDPQVPRDVEKAIRHIPEARLSCAPAAEPSKFDQPNTFMRKVTYL